MIKHRIGIAAGLLSCLLWSGADLAFAQSNPLGRLLNDNLPKPGGQTQTQTQTPAQPDPDRQVFDRLSVRSPASELRAFLQAFPGSTYAAQVRQWLSAAESAEADAQRIARCDQRWSSLSQSCAASEIEAFVQSCGESQYIVAAEQRLVGIQIGVMCRQPTQPTKPQPPTPQPPTPQPPTPQPLKAFPLTAESHGIPKSMIL